MPSGPFQAQSSTSPTNSPILHRHLRMLKPLSPPSGAVALTISLRGNRSRPRSRAMPYVLSSQVCALLKRFSYSRQAFLDRLRLITSSDALHRRRRIAKRSLEGATARRRLSCSVPIEATRHSESPQSWISRPRGVLPSLYHFPAKQRCAETSKFAMAGGSRPLSSDASES